MVIRLTDKVVKTLPPPASGNRVTFDTELKGFRGASDQDGGPQLRAELQHPRAR